MTLQVYRDVSCADAAVFISEVVFKLLLNSWTYVAHSTGSGGARSASQPADAAALAAILKTGPSSWVVLQYGDRKISFHRATTANPDYTSWKFEYTATGALTTGSATAPDRNSTDSQYAGGNSFRVLGPATGGVADAIKAHIIVDDAGPSFIGIARRTPLPSGNVGFFSAIGLDVCTNLVWAANPDPVVAINVSTNSNNSDSALLGATYSSSWLGYGLPGAAWTVCSLENPGAVAGATNVDKSGVDVLYQARWVFSTGAGHIGTSSLFRLLHPGRTPVVGIDAGGELNWAAFWSFAVVNDGIALGS
jgi:hypothetical protein